MIEVRDLVKTFGDLKALDGLNMTVEKGSVYGLVGPNGAGKSTLISHLAGVYEADSGTVKIDGEPVFENPATKGKIAYIPSDFYYYNQARVKDLRDLYAELFPTFSLERFNKLNEAFDIDQSRSIRSLSKGMKKQVAFWLALSQMPEVMLLDEPADGLDPMTRHTAWGLVLDDVAERGMTVLTSSHNLRELSDVCDYVGIMSKGRMFMERSLMELQGNFVKVQVALADGVEMPAVLDVVNSARQGRIYTYVLRGTADEARASFMPLDPVLFEAYPLSLEEIFIYELGGDRDGIAEILA